MSMITSCKNCGLPIFHGAAGYAGAQCRCGFSAKPNCGHNALADLLKERDQVKAKIGRLERKLAAPQPPVQEPVAYLDIGIGGYVDLGSDKPIEELEKLPMGRHMLAIIGTYGVDGYTVAPQPSDDAKDDWTPSDYEYDRSIHHNPDAKAWAEFFVATFPALKDKEDLMHSWFANAMMAMHDYLKNQPAQDDAKDAARYRWMREQTWDKARICVVTNPKESVRLGYDCPSTDRLDAAIDAAMAGGSDE